MVDRTSLRTIRQFDDGVNATLVQSGDHHSTPKGHRAGQRDKAKTLIYATIYGAGDYRLAIVMPDENDDDMVRAIGHDIRALLVSGIRGFADLFRWLDRCDDLEGLDGRKLVARKKHAKLNTLLQAAGAILCKRWLLLIDAELHQRGLRHGEDYEFLAWIHDEVQIAARTPEIAGIVAEVCKEQAVKAGEYYGLACPTAGESKIGTTWATTH
jgi:DNA polymerase I-like protein with 3'-5' exonuclease and polymerase domains